MTILDEYIETLTSKSAKNSYRSNLKSYFRFLCPDPENELKIHKNLGIPLTKKQNKFIENYFKSNRNYEKDVIEFHRSSLDSPAKTVKSKIASVKGFLMENDIELKEKKWKQISKRTRGSRAVTIDRVPTKEELKQILQHGTVKDRSLFFVLSSSGMRIGEACKIKLDDIDLDNDPSKITIRAKYTKSSNYRIVYISKEATEITRQWLLERDRYLEVASKRLNFNEKFKKSAIDDRVFPFNTSTARLMWGRLIKKAGFDQRDPTTGWYKMHIHTLRKYFSSNLNVVGMPGDVVEALLGHEDRLRRVYNLYTEKQLGELYQKSVHGITVFESSVEEERIKKQQKEINELKNQMDMLTECLEVATPHWITYMWNKMDPEAREKMRKEILSWPPITATTK